MRFNRPLAVLGLSALAVATAAFAAPTTAPTTQKAKPLHLTVPWNKVADLTEEQKGEINTIHEDTWDKIKALEAAEHDKCMAVLTDAQKKALDETLAKEAADKKKPSKKK